MSGILKLTGVVYSTRRYYSDHEMRQMAMEACAEKLGRALLTQAHHTPLILQAHTQTRNEGERIRHEHTAFIMPFELWAHKHLEAPHDATPFEVTEAPICASEVLWRIPSPFSKETIFVKANTFEVKK